MEGPEKDRIRCLADELDRLVGRDAAWVRLDQYGGGPDEGRIVANQDGFLRFGIEFLKAGLTPRNAHGAGQTVVPLDLKYLVKDDSVINFDEFIRDDTPPGTKPGLGLGVDLTAFVLQVGCIPGILAMVVLAAGGAITVIRRLM